MRKTKTYTLTNALIQRYADYLQEQERAGATIQKYVHDLTALLDFRSVVVPPFHGCNTP